MPLPISLSSICHEMHNSTDKLIIMRNLLRIICLSCLLCTAASLLAQDDSLRAHLSHAPIQEKVYLHLDNNCYFLGDTLWYKSYVVRADDLTPTDMSRIVYVELVSPDGFVVERQQLIVSPDGYGAGDFVLSDSLYSGYYELRAYTRWMMNFNVTERPYNRVYREEFYNRQMAKDFFRDYGGVYSRVVPVYEKPEQAGDYSLKNIIPRPRQRALPVAKPQLNVSFFPEGGNRMAGATQRIAFEVTNEQGEAVNLTGTIGQQAITADHMGRGVFTLSGDNPAQKALFDYKGKTYSFDLPKAENKGVTLALTQGRMQVKAIGLGVSSLSAAVLCRGALKDYQPLQLDATGAASSQLDLSKLPTGVCDLVVLDPGGLVLADRLFFVNHHDSDARQIRVEGLKKEYAPYEKITLKLSAPEGLKTMSLAVRDNGEDIPSYDTGNIMTDLLLSSDLKGFVANPDYYFEADDSLHQARLDLLLLVQGWRRYDVKDLLADKPLRYKPETAMTVEGDVYPSVHFNPIEPEEMPWWKMGIFGWTIDAIMASGEQGEFGEYSQKISDGEGMNYLADQEKPESEQNNLQTRRADVISNTAVSERTDNEPQATNQTDSEQGVNHGSLKKEVTIKGELVLGTDVWQIEQQTDHGGHFAFSVEPFYGEGTLMMGAYGNNKDKKKKKQKQEDYDLFDEDAWPDYYVKRNLFYPVFASKYSFYQTHQPGASAAPTEEEEADSLTGGGTDLAEVSIKARRRKSKHAINWNKPACQYDAIELYNLLTDYGLSYGKVNFRRLPLQMSMMIMGNYKADRMFLVDARFDRYLFYRTYTPDEAAAQATPTTRSNWAIYKDAKLKRLQTAKFYTDFSLRQDDHPEMSSKSADVVVDFDTMPQDATRYTMRDRRIILHGFNMPDDFYHPDYSTKPLPTHKDYRRTLYWNPNLQINGGDTQVDLYNGSNSATLTVSGAAVGSKGPCVTSPSRKQ